jgi:transposase
MDMWKGFVNASLEAIPGADKKIAFDKSHIAQSLGDAVIKVRRQDHQSLLALGDEMLKGSKYLWQTNAHNVSAKQAKAFKDGRDSSLTTAWAWAIKKVARMIKDHLWGIINTVVLKANNGQAESTNSRIKMIKLCSRGFSNKDRFKTAIYFHLSGLDLYPEAIK